MTGKMVGEAKVRVTGQALKGLDLRLQDIVVLLNATKIDLVPHKDMYEITFPLIKWED